jgi:hypothetical protein
MVLEYNKINKHSTLSRSCPVKALDSIERSSCAKRWRSTYDDGAKGWRCCTVLWSRQSQCCFFCLRHAKGHVGPNLIQFADSLPSHPVMKSFEPALWPSLLIWLMVGKVPMQMPMVFVQVPMQPQQQVAQQVVPMMQKGREQLLAEATVENFILCVCESLCECVFVCLCLYVSVSLFCPSFWSHTLFILVLSFMDPHAPVLFCTKSGPYMDTSNFVRQARVAPPRSPWWVNC